MVLEYLLELNKPTHPMKKFVNNLVSLAFGKGFKGNYFSLASLFDGPDILPGKEPGIILKPALITTRIAGRFTNTGGSAMEIFPQYKTNAETYDKLYEELTGRKVKIIVSDRIYT